MNILLTGSGGFIGKNLKNYLGDKSRLLREIPDFEFTTMEVGLKKLYEYKKEQNLQLI